MHHPRRNRPRLSTPVACLLTGALAALGGYLAAAHTAPLGGSALAAAVVDPAPSTAPAVRAQPSPDYVDDRSTAQDVITSLYSAINARQYVRAYSYWEPGAVQRGAVPAFGEFQQGYANTKSVEVTMGTVTSGVGAGQLYWSVPVTLVSTQTDGSTQTFVGCYQLHLSQPALQAVPPFQPMGIQSASIQPVANDADTATLMVSACKQ